MTKNYRQGTDQTASYTEDTIGPSLIPVENNPLIEQMLAELETSDWPENDEDNAMTPGEIADLVHELEDPDGPAAEIADRLTLALVGAIVGNAIDERSKNEADNPAAILQGSNAGDETALR